MSGDGRLRLADLVSDSAAGGASRAARRTALLATRLYFERPRPPAAPGFLVARTDEGPLIAVFTSVSGLALYAGACDWASTTVEDLVGLLPDGVRALVDPLGEQPLVLDGEVLRALVEDAAEVAVPAPATRSDRPLPSVGALNAEHQEGVGG
ncbi:SseB family protein [Streptomyces sp. AC536]|uniref:SseB family protein n=1 Tax=Streptomyces buecherae TaxID=2763006 RepID=UPI00164E7988|nr:SseB family protein [Streptomyces buecherae]MBC3981947.1 SseB family protein [Streptomyces buecherae]QNJ41821.1 SseB family protein [Streptomyces buecherae]